jgi:hypothetical protein
MLGVGVTFDALPNPQCWTSPFLEMALKTKIQKINEFFLKVFKKIIEKKSKKICKQKTTILLVNMYTVAVSFIAT